MEAKALITQELIPQDPATQELNSQEPTTQVQPPTGAPDPESSDAGPDADGGEADPRAERADPTRPLLFSELGVAEPIRAALAAAGITTAFPIQALTLPIAFDGHDIIGQARTGTGKTFAFGIPIVEHLRATSRSAPAAPRALVVVPTRELAIQVAEDLRLICANSAVNVVTLYGGRAYEPQIEALATVDVVVGTPGRLLDLSRQRQLDLSRTDVLVLDEADRMLDLGFLPDVEAILRLTPDDRQTMLFSATMPSEVVTLARRHLHRPTHIRAEQHDEPAHVPTTDQHVFRAHHLDKVEVLARVLQANSRGLAIVFCRTRRACDTVTTALTERGFAAAAVHGDLGQSQRERALRAFRSGKVDVLVATDVAARGLDVDDVTHVINHECPEDEKAYLHRTGRTGRAGRTGVAVTFVDWQDMARWKVINDTLNLGHPEPIETYSTSEHLYQALGIPPEAKGVLPRARRERAGLEAEELEDIGETGRGRTRPRPAGDPGRRAGRTGADSRHEGGQRRDRGSRHGAGSAGSEAADRGSRHGAGSAGSEAAGQGDSGDHAGRADHDGHAERDGREAGGRRRPGRRRTRAGVPLTPAAEATTTPAPIPAPAGTAPAAPAVFSAPAGPAAVFSAPAGPAAAANGRPRRRRRPSRARSESQHGSTRPATHAEQRDLTAD